MQILAARRGTSLLLLALSALPIGIVSAQETGNTPASTTVQPGDVNLQVSRIYTFVDKTGFGHQHGVEGRLRSGSLSVGAAQSAGSLVFDMTSFEADTEAARRYLGMSGSTDASTRSKVTKNMKSRDVLDVAQFPTATFTIESATATGKSSRKGRPVYELTGRFELHGRTQRIRIPVEVEQARGWLHVQGQFSIRQSSFGIEPYTAALGAIGVADTLEIHGDLWVAPTEQVAMEAIPERT
jgi:polyisoprenoid-binding protein YceI